MALLLLLAGISVALYPYKLTFDENVVNEEIEEPVEAEEPMELPEEAVEVEEPAGLVERLEVKEPEDVGGQQTAESMDDDLQFFYRTYLGEMNFLLNVLDSALDGTLDMELDEFYDWLEEEDVILSNYDEIIERAEKGGMDMDWLPELEELLNIDSLFEGSDE